MSREKDIRGAILGLGETNTENHIKICEVIQVDITSKTADLKPLDGSAELLDVYLVVDADSIGKWCEPVIGSLVAVDFISDEIGLVVSFSKLKTYKIEIGNTILQMDTQGFLLKKENETLKKLMNDLVKAIQQMQFATPNGPTTGLLTTSQFTVISQRFNQFLN